MITQQYKAEPSASFGESVREINDQTPSKKKSTNTIKTLEKFYVFPSEIRERYRARCKECGSALASTLRGASNLVTHLKLKHLNQYESYKAERDKLKVCSDPRRLGLRVTNIRERVKPDMFQLNHPSQIKGNGYVTKWLAISMAPLSIIETQEFADMIHGTGPQYNVPSNKTLEKLIAADVKTMKDNIIKQLKEAAAVVLTIDLWSSRQMRSYMGVTAHYMLRWRQKSAMIACKRFKGRHTAERILSTYNEIVRDFELDGKVLMVVTDNATNMMKAFRLIDGQESEDTESDADEEDTLICEQGGEQNLYRDIETEHYTCFCHTLQLVVKDGLKAMPKSYQTSINKALAIISLVRMSTVERELLEQNDLKRLQAANLTQWNSTLVAIQSVLRIPADKLDELGGSLTQGERRILDEIVVILHPFQTATLNVQQDSSSGALLIPTILLLESEMMALQLKYDNPLLTALDTAMTVRFTKYKSSEIYKLCTILDPRFKVQLEGFDHEESKKLLIKYITLNTPFSDETVTSASSTSPNEHATKRFKSTFAKLMRERPKTYSSRQGETISLEVKQYLEGDICEEEADPATYWQNSNLCPLIRAIVPRYYCALASSAPVERLFSAAGKNFRPERYSLSDITFESLLYLRSNQEFY